MILSDQHIAEAMRAERLVIDPFTPSALQPSSVDLHLGDSFVLVRHGAAAPEQVLDPAAGKVPEFEKVTVAHLELRPGDFVLGTTLEVIGLADDLVGRLEGKSSLARIGLAPHAEAGFIDPGFVGQITLERPAAAPPFRKGGVKAAVETHVGSGDTPSR